MEVASACGCASGGEAVAIASEACRGAEPHETSLRLGCSGAVSRVFESLTNSAEDSSSSTMGASSTQCKKLNRLGNQALAKAGNIGKLLDFDLYCQPLDKCLTGPAHVSSAYMRLLS